MPFFFITLHTGVGHNDLKFLYFSLENQTMNTASNHLKRPLSSLFLGPAGPLQQSHAIGQRLLAHALSLLLPAQLRLRAAEADAEVPRLGEDEQLGGLVGGGNLRHADLEGVEGVLEVDASLALEGIVKVTHIAPLDPRPAASCFLVSQLPQLGQWRPAVVSFLA
jgi:hypothetical protein